MNPLYILLHLNNNIQFQSRLETFLSFFDFVAANQVIQKL